MEKKTYKDEGGRIMNVQHYFKKLDKFSVCALKAKKGTVEVEEDSESCAIYQYVFSGSARIGRPFKSEFFDVKTGDFFSMKEFIYQTRLYEALDDFYMFGFNVLNREEDWSGRLLRDEKLKVDNESVIICLDGNPIINNKELFRFDYSELSEDKTYNIELNQGVVALFSRM